MESDPSQRKQAIAMGYIWGAAIGVLLLQWLFASYNTIETIPYSQFEQLVSYGANVRVKGVHRTLIERLGHKSSEALVVWIVKSEHRRPQGSGRHIAHHVAPQRGVRCLARIDGERPVRHHVLDILEPGQKEPPQLCVSVDRILRTQAVEVFMRTLAETGSSAVS